jgi:hypothetical protein
MSQALWPKWVALEKPSFIQTASYYVRKGAVCLCWEGDRVADDFHAWWEKVGFECTEYLVVNHDGTEESKESYGCYHDHPFKLNQSIKVWID